MTKIKKKKYRSTDEQMIFVERRKHSAHPDLIWGKRDMVQAGLVASAVGLFAVCLLGALFVPTSSQIYIFLVGQCSGVFMAVYGFYFSAMFPNQKTDLPKVIPPITPMEQPELDFSLQRKEG